jgi:hypothetical protein
MPKPKKDPNIWWIIRFRTSGRSIGMNRTAGPTLYCSREMAISAAKKKFKHLSTEELFETFEFRAVRLTLVGLV